MRLIQLSQGLQAIVDAETYEWASKFKWHAHKGKHGNFYAARNVRLPSGRRTRIFLHREILKAPPGAFSDHKDGNGLNDRLRNLRLCSIRQNNCNTEKRRGNTSGHKGVSEYRRKGVWVAQIASEGKKIHLGYFKTPLEAAHAYDKAAIALHGEFARLNFPKNL